MNESEPLKMHELDDGTTEVVDRHPPRKLPSVPELDTLVMGGNGSLATGEFVHYRGPLGAAKIAASQLPLLAALWRLWAAQRTRGEPAGVSVEALAEATGEGAARVYDSMRTLLRHQAARKVSSYGGWQANQVRYFPTELGTVLNAMIAYLGRGASIQIGRTATAWKNRSNDEPESFFRHAALLSQSI